MQTSSLGSVDGSTCLESRKRIVLFLDHIFSFAMSSTLSRMSFGILTEVTCVVSLLYFVVFMTTSYYIRLQMSTINYAIIFVMLLYSFVVRGILL